MSYDVRRAIYGKLAGDSTLNALLGTPPSGTTKSIYFQQAVDNATFPYVIFFQSSGTPVYAFETITDGKPAFDNEIWTVKAVDRSDSGDGADRAADRINVLLTDGVLSISGRTQLYLRRESDLPGFTEVTDGVRYIHAGALFRLVYE